MNFLLLEVLGANIIFRGGSLEGRTFRRGETVWVGGQDIAFSLSDFAPSDRSSPRDTSYYMGVWFLQRTTHRGKPAICCCYFDKKTGMPTERYLKALNRDGFYMCGPKFPRWKRRDLLKFKA